MIKDRIFVYVSASKADCIINYCEKNGINLKNIIFDDDVIKYLREAEIKGINSWLLSSTLKDMLGNDSNIIRFQTLFDIENGNSCISDIIN